MIETFLKEQAVKLFVLVYALLSIFVLSNLIAGSDGNPHTRKSHVGVWADWRPNDRPVVYRILMPTMVGATNSLIPDFVRSSLTPYLVGFRDSSLGWYLFRADPKNVVPALTEDNIFDTIVKTVLVYLSLIAFVWMLYKLTSSMFPDSRIYALVAPVIALLYIPIPARHYTYTYDMLELFFSCACLYLLHQNKWRLYLATFLIATLNKETTIFAAIFYFLWFYDKLPSGRYWRIGFTQVFIWVGLRIGLAYWFINYVGEDKGLTRNLFLRNILHLLDYSYYSLFFLFSGTLVILYRWSEKPRFLRAGLWMVAANILAYLKFCTPGEYRDLYWCLPVLILLATHTLISAVNMDKDPLSSSVP